VVQVRHATRRQWTLTLVILLSVPGTAAASARVTLRPAAAVPGSTVEVVGTGFRPRAAVSVWQPGRRAARSRADGAGGFSTSMVVPPGPWRRLRVVSSGGGRRVANALVRGRRDVAEVAADARVRLRWAPTAGDPGTSVTVAAFGLPAGRRARLSLLGHTFSSRASGTRRLRWTVPIPSAAPGRYIGRLRTWRLTLRFDVVIRAPLLPTVTPPPVADTTPPETTLRAWPAATTSSSSASFAFSADDPAARFECRLDGGAVASCGSPMLYSSLADGPHVFSVAAIDPAGNRDPTPAQRTWTVDTIAPAPTLEQPDDGAATNNRTPTLAGLAGRSPGDDDHVEVALAAGAGAPPRTLTAPVDRDTGAWHVSALALDDGTYSARVTQRDTAGNVGSSAANGFTVDATPPDTTIETGPDAATNATTATVTFSATEDGATYQCRLDDKEPTSCDGTVEYHDLGDGRHTVAVTAIDPLGNADLTPAQRTWTVDTKPPDTTIQTGPDETANATTATLTFSASEPGSTYECRLDDSEPTNCDGTIEYHGLVDGPHSVAVTAIDPVGNADPTPAERTWTVDTTAPDTTIQEGPDATTNATTARLSFSASEDGATYECRLDDQEPTNCDGTVEYDALVEGAHEFSVTASDRAGNADPTPAQRTWTVDTTAPDTHIWAGASGPSQGASAVFAFTSDDAGAGFQCRLDDEDFAPCSSPATFTNVPEGAHSFDVRAVDVAGNADPSPVTQHWTRTPATAAADVVVAAAGDISCAGCAQGQTATLIKDVIKPQAVLGLGDYQYPTGTLARMQAYYEPTWGAFKDITYPISGGSHDFYGTGDYLAYFGNGPAQLQPEGSYSFDVGNWHAIALNSYCFEPDPSTCDAAAVTAWLEADLAASAATCTVAYLHEPYWTSTTTMHQRDTKTRPWIDALYDAGADVLLQGHNHDYERFRPQKPTSGYDPARGLAAFVVGTGGNTLYPFTNPTPPVNSVIRDSATFGVLKLVLKPAGYDFEFVPVPGAMFTDSGSGSCH
jgi:Bacterial Ig-like domain